MQTSPNERNQPFDGRANTTPAKPGKLLRLPRVQELTGFGKSSIYSGVKGGTFPAPVRLSARAVGWRESDVFQWIESRTTTGAV